MNYQVLAYDDICNKYHIKLVIDEKLDDGFRGAVMSVLADEIVFIKTSPQLCTINLEGERDTPLQVKPSNVRIAFDLPPKCIDLHDEWNH